MSTTRITEKPKRPLSGYNLFYRYKRSMVLEATSNFAEGVSSDEEKEAIGSVLNALPGLEGVPANHPVWSFPSHVRNELRARSIRKAMEGKLLPNENTRSRLHRKVHGMGFVEMGKIMRSMWADIDKFTKEVFSELADVGRVTYRVRLAEYKLQLNLGSLSSMESLANSARIVHATPSTPTKKPASFAAFVSPLTSQSGVMMCQAISPASSSIEKKENSLEPIPFSPSSASPKSLERRVSNEIGNSQYGSPQCQQFNSQFGLLGNVPPPPLFQLDSSPVCPGSSEGELKFISSQVEDEVDTEDLLALIGELDDVLDHHSTDSHCDQETKVLSNGPAMIFGKPVHDVQRTAITTAFRKKSSMNNVAARTA